MKKTLSNFTALTRGFRRDEDGATALTFALGLTVMLMGVGVGVDFAAASKAQSKGQSIADASALAAAAFVEQNDGELPASDKEGLKNGKWYKSSDLGWEFQDYIVDGADGVMIKVDYFDEYAIATVKGKTKPAVVGLFGVSEMDFNAEAQVTYPKNSSGQAASVFLLMDNSGSMAWDDSGGEPRMDGLIDSVNGFQKVLSKVTEDLEAGDQRPLRMGMIPYTGRCEYLGDMCISVRDNGIVGDQLHEEDFGLIDQAKVDGLIPRALTNPIAALELAQDWMADEEQVHRDELLRTSPSLYDEDDFKVLKYIVLMTDGANSSDEAQCVEKYLPQNTGWHLVMRDGDGHRYYERRRYRLVEYNYVGADPAERDYSGSVEAQWSFDSWDSKSRRYLARTHSDTGFRKWTLMPRSRSYHLATRAQDRWAAYDARVSGWQRSKRTTSSAGEWDKWDFHRPSHSVRDITSQRSTTPYYECDRVQTPNLDQESLRICQELIDDGVEIFTIGYGLDPAEYDTNWAMFPKATISKEQSDRAFGNLKACASKPENFKRADDADSLSSVFDKIGQTIAKESMRVSR